MALSDSWLKSNNGKARDKVEVVTDRDALSVRISPKGRIVFQYRYRLAGVAKRMDIGTYPLLSLKDARLCHSMLSTNTSIFITKSWMGLFTHGLKTIGIKQCSTQIGL